MTVISDIVRAEIDNIMASVVAPEPIVKIFKVSSADYSPIRIQLIEHLKCEHPSVFKDDVVRHSSVELDLNNRVVNVKWNARVDITQSIVYKCYITVRVFIINMYHTKNNKLTALYRWYNMRGDQADRDIELQADMFQVAKYILANEKQLKCGDDTTNGIIQALELIKAKHEARGIGAR